MCGSNASQKMSIAMCDRHHYTLENEMLMKKYVIMQNIEKVVLDSGSQHQSITSQAK